jgi:hypothetical protein
LHLAGYLKIHPPASIPRKRVRTTEWSSAIDDTYSHMLPGMGGEAADAMSKALG